MIKMRFFSTCISKLIVENNLKLYFSFVTNLINFLLLNLDIFTNSLGHLFCGALLVNFVGGLEFFTQLHICLTSLLMYRFVSLF